VSERIPDNLALLYDAFGEDAINGILPGDSFELEGVEFVCQYRPDSTAERFYIVKNLALVDRYRQLSERFSGSTIVELGIAEGGSTALLALQARPEKLIAVDLEPDPLRALSEFIETHGFGDVVRPYYGVDQSDREGLGALVDAELDGRPLDLVIDDCSHMFDPTRSSFETLFPRLRPDGLYIIEDWNADHVIRDSVRAYLSDTTAPDHEARQQAFRESYAEVAAAEASEAKEPLTRLAVELLVARSSLTDVIAEVSVDEFWIVVRRGPGAADPKTFRLSDNYTDYFGFVPPRRVSTT
jgi:predicted O-methyltransferase YrrM